MVSAVERTVAERPRTLVEELANEAAQMLLALDNRVGGVRITEPAADLAVLMAIISSLKNKALPEKLIVFGEVGLAGEVRPAPRGQERLREAAKLGFTRAIIPEANRPRQAIAGMQVVAVSRVEEAVEKMRAID